VTYKDDSPYSTAALPPWWPLFADSVESA